MIRYSNRSQDITVVNVVSSILDCLNPPPAEFYFLAHVFSRFKDLRFGKILAAQMIGHHNNVNHNLAGGRLLNPLYQVTSDVTASEDDIINVNSNAILLAAIL